MLRDLNGNQIAKAIDSIIIDLAHQIGMDPPPYPTNLKLLPRVSDDARLQAVLWRKIDYYKNGDIEKIRMIANEGRMVIDEDRCWSQLDKMDVYMAEGNPDRVNSNRDRIRHLKYILDKWQVSSEAPIGRIPFQIANEKQ